MSQTIVFHAGPDGIIADLPAPRPRNDIVRCVRLAGGPYDGLAVPVRELWRRLFVPPRLPDYPWDAIYVLTADPGVWDYNGDAVAEEWD